MADKIGKIGEDYLKVLNRLKNLKNDKKQKDLDKNCPHLKDALGSLELVLSKIKQIDEIINRISKGSVKKSIFSKQNDFVTTGIVKPLLLLEKLLEEISVTKGGEKKKSRKIFKWW